MKNATLKTPYGRLWIAFFLYACSVACAVQFFVLPVLLPQWHTGNGLFTIGDFPKHHRLATELAEAIRAQGWGAWTLRPGGQGNDGIAGAIYALTVSEPWTLIPMNAALHATAALALLWLAQLFLRNWRQAVWCVLPFLLYPTSVLWYAQNLKDGYSIAGFLLFLCGWVAWIRMETWQRRRWFPAWPLGWMALGILLVWVVRPYMLQMMQGVAVLLAIGGTVAFFIAWRRRRLKGRQSFLGMGLLWVVIFTVTTPELLKGGVFGNGWFFELDAPIDNVSTDGDSTRADDGELVWYNSAFLPPLLEGIHYRIALLRHSFIRGYPTAGSKIDFDVSFHSAADILIYTPKAALIALLYPLPTQWAASSSADTAWTRPFVTLEMAGLYVWLAFLPLFLWRYRLRSEAWVIVCFCTGMVTIYALTTPNLGTLYRVRYGFIMALAALGVAELVRMVNARRKTLAEDTPPLQE